MVILANISGWRICTWMYQKTWDRTRFRNIQHQRGRWYPGPDGHLQWAPLLRRNPQYQPHPGGGSPQDSTDAQGMDLHFYLSFSMPELCRASRNVQTKSVICQDQVCRLVLPVQEQVRLESEPDVWRHTNLQPTPAPVSARRGRLRGRRETERKVPPPSQCPCWLRWTRGGLLYCTVLYCTVMYIVLFCVRPTPAPTQERNHSSALGQTVTAGTRWKIIKFKCQIKYF